MVTIRDQETNVGGSREEYPYLGVYWLLRQFFNFKQGEHKCNNAFLKQFLELSSSLKQSKVNVMEHEHLKEIEFKHLMEEGTA